MHIVGLQPQSDPFPTPPKKGTTVYDRSGVEYEFDRALSDTEWLCFPLMETYGWEGEPEYHRSDSPLILTPTNLYPKPPRQVVTKDLDEKLKELREIEQKLSTARADLRQFEVEEKARQARILQHEKLKLLDDWTGGKITHLIHLEKYGGFRIVPVSEEMTDDGSRYNPKKKMRLLTLWGSTEGDLNWRIGEYSDQSGSNYEVMPFASEDDARKWLQTFLLECLADWDGQSRVAGGKDVQAIYKALTQHNFTVPDQVEDFMRRARIASAQAAADKAREAFHNATNWLNEARRS